MCLSLRDAGRNSGANAPLTLWFTATIIAHTGNGYLTFVVWLKTPINAVLMILLLMAPFYHPALGLQVVIENYVRSGARFAVVIARRLACWELVTGALMAVMWIALSG